MQVNKQAVKAAFEAYGDRYRSITAMKAALTAALPYLQGVKVKKLTWSEYDDEQGIPDRWDAEAICFGVFYSIELQHDGYRVVFDYEAVGAVGLFDTLEEAKAAAQADYEARILSALEPSAARELVLEVIKSELSGNTGELIDMVACAIRADGSDLCDGAWESLSDDHKLAWRGDAERALAAVKEYLTTRALSSPDHADAGKVEGDGWLPIESASKDGTEVLGFDALTKIMHVTFCIQGYWHDPDSHYYSEAPNFNPTHWRPLPSAPSQEVA